MMRSTQTVLGVGILLLSVCAAPSHAVLSNEESHWQTSTLDVPRGLGRAGDSLVAEIERGKAILLHTDFAASRVAIGDPEIADFVAITDRVIEVISKNVGDTNLLVWGENRLQAVVDIRVRGLHPRIVRDLTRLLNNPDIEVDVAGTAIVLRGFVPDLLQYEQAGRLATAFITKAGPVIGGQPPAEAPEVINLLQVGSRHQVMIEVVIAELSRTFRRAFGVNLVGKVTNGSTQAATFQTLLKNLATSTALGGADPTSIAGSNSFAESVTLAASYFQTETMDLRIFLEAVEASQMGTILAEPTLVARSGEKASFLVGGETPIPMITGRGGLEGTEYTVLFKKFGVNVDFTPTVLAEDRIHLRIAPEVSEPDFSQGVRVFGDLVPSFRTRRVITAVELGDGETFVLAGLIREDHRADKEGFPLLSKIPLLGNLFRVRSYQKTQQELVMLVTPHLVQPIEPGVRVELPTDHLIEPTQKEFYWDGLIEGHPREPDGTEDARTGSNEVIDEPALGGFVGAVGYRIASPRPTGGIE